MKYWHITFSTALFAVAAPLAAQNDQVAFGPSPDWARVSEPLTVPDDADGAIFLRRQDTVVHLGSTGQHYYQGQTLRILHPQALQAGNVSLVWNPAAGQPTVHKLRIHRAGRVIDVLEKASFEILRREDQLETAMLDGMLTAVLRVPDLRVGDDLEFDFTVPSHDPTFPETNSGLLFLAQTPPKGRVRLALSWADGHKPATRLTPDLQGLAQKSRNAIELHFDNPESLTPPNDAPPRYAWMRILEYTDFTSWNDVSQRFFPLFEAASLLPPGSALRDEAAYIAQAHSTDFDRAQAALKLVQQQVRYIYVGLNGGNLRPSTADETWDRRYGDCKGKTVMLLGLLNALGIEAEAVLVNNSGGDDGLDARLPNPGMFDHVLVRATIGGRKYWLDGTMPDVVGLREAPILPYRWVLPLKSNGSDLEQLSQEAPKYPTEMGLYEIDARAGFDQPARQVQTTVKRGIDGVIEYAQFSALSDAQLQSAFREAFIGGGQWYDIENVAYRYDRKTDSSILTVTGTAPVDWDDEGNGSYDLTLPGGGFSPPNRRQRPSGQDQSAPFYSRPYYGCHATTVRLPEGTSPTNWGFNSTFDTMLFGRAFYRMMEKNDDGSIRMVRGSKVIDTEISAERANRDNDRVRDFDNSMAHISFDPDRQFESWGNLRKVPTVYDFDWIASAIHCLPPDLTEQE